MGSQGGLPEGVKRGDFIHSHLIPHFWFPNLLESSLHPVLMVAIMSPKNLFPSQFLIYPKEDQFGLGGLL